MGTSSMLVAYCLVSFCASLAGGWIPHFVRLTHRRMQIGISFVSGVMLGIGLLHLIPHSLAMLSSIDVTVRYVMAGFLCMFFLERFFHFHHHEAQDEEPEDASTGNHSECRHGQVKHGAAARTHRPRFSWIGAAIGLTLHALIDGTVMAAAVQAEGGTAGMAGLGAFLAICLHKPLDSLTIGTLMNSAGQSSSVRHLVNGAYSLVTPLGALLFVLASNSFAGSQQELGRVLGFAAGAFVCIASSDLLPELQFHRHDRLWLSAALVIGIALAWSTIFLEHSGHSHLPQVEHAPDHAEEHGHDHAGEHRH